MKRTRAQQAERDAWQERRAWPVVVLGVDPGAVAGAAIVAPDTASGRVVEASVVDPMTTELEDVVHRALDLAAGRDMELVLALEDWGSGGMMHIDTWLGLGAARGHWERVARMLAPSTPRLVASRCCLRIRMTMWRSFMIPESGTRDAEGKFTRYDTEGWKKAATARLAELQPHVSLERADAAEASLLGLYAIRSDEVGRRLPDRTLRAHGFDVAATRAMMKA